MNGTLNGTIKMNIGNYEQALDNRQRAYPFKVSPMVELEVRILLREME